MESRIAALPTPRFQFLQSSSRTSVLLWPFPHLSFHSSPFSISILNTHSSTSPWLGLSHSANPHTEDRLSATPLLTLAAHTTSCEWWPSQALCGMLERIVVYQSTEVSTIEFAVTANYTQVWAPFCGNDACMLRAICVIPKARERDNLHSPVGRCRKAMLCRWCLLRTVFSWWW